MTTLKRKSSKDVRALRTSKSIAQGAMIMLFGLRGRTAGIQTMDLFTTFWL